MSIQFLKSAAILIVLMSFSGCASSVEMQTLLSKDQVKRILAEEKIKRVTNVEQQPQDDGTVSLLVDSNLRETSFSGCLFDRIDLEVVQSGGKWVVNSMSEHAQLLLVSCDKARDAPSVYISGDYSDEKVGKAVSYLKDMLSGSLTTELILSSQELQDAVKDVGLDDVHSMLIEGNDIEFQVLSKALVPRLLGIRFSIEGGQLKGVSLNDENSIEVTEGL